MHAEMWNSVRRLLSVTALSAVVGDATVVDCGKGLTIAFDSTTGRWSSLRCRNVELLGGGGPDIYVRCSDGPAWPGEERWRAAPPRVVRTEKGVRVVVDKEADGWRCRLTYDIDPAACVIRRTARVQPPPATSVRIHATVLCVPGVTLAGAADAVWSLPAEFPAAEYRIPEATPGRRVRERGWTWAETGIGYAFSAAERIGVIAAYELDLDRARVAVEEQRGGVSFEHVFETWARLKPGQALDRIGVQYVRVAVGDRSALKVACRDTARETAGGPPADRPEWLEGAVIAELHPWGRLEDWNGGDRGNRFRNLAEELPWLERLGVTAVWLLPVSEKPPWVYHLPKFGRIDPQVGTAEELRQFIAESHRRGMRVLMDVVTYGVAPDSPEVATFPDEVWCRNEQGERVRVWGNSVLAADCSHPAWRERTVQRVLHWVQDFGCDGFRLDCGGVGQAANWRPVRGVRANQAVFAGGIGQNRLIRRAIRAVNPEAVLLPEAGANAHFQAADMLFDYPLYMVFRAVNQTPDLAEWVRRLQAWLESRQYTLSPEQEAAQVRFLENHDCVAATEIFGVGPSQALTALIAFLPGVMLLHQDQEIGFSDDLRKWLRLRRELPELRKGDGDYRSVQASDPHVIAFARVTADGIAVVGVNFGPRPVSCALRWPTGWESRFPVCRDVFTGQTIAQGREVAFAPWRPAVLVLRREGAGLPIQARPPVAPDTDAASLVRARRDDAQRTVLQFNPVREWYVLTHEGVLRGVFRDRHRKVRPNERQWDVISPLKRCFRPFEAGLFDGPGPVRVGVASADGRWADVFLPDASIVRHLRIEPRSLDGRDVQIAFEFNQKTHPSPSVTEGTDVESRLSELKQSPTESVVGRVIIGPLHVQLDLGGAHAVFARRLGGALIGLRGPTGTAWIAEPSEVYSDYGLFRERVHAASTWETTPRLQIAQTGSDGAEGISFVGRLHRPSWNGVQFAQVMQPPVQYRVTYLVNGPNRLKIETGLTPAAGNVREVTAFFAWRASFRDVVEWEARFDGSRFAAGRVGDAPGKRLFETRNGPWKERAAEMRLFRPAEILTIRVPVHAGPAPSNVFLLGDRSGRLHLFAAVLDGGRVQLEPGREYALSFELELRKQGAVDGQR